MGGNDPMGYYKILGVNYDAPPNLIKKKYREMALRFHPDKNPDNREEAEEKFKKILQAYHILSDPEKRRAYDMGLCDDEGIGRSHAGNMFNFTQFDMDQLLRNFHADFFGSQHSQRGFGFASHGPLFETFFSEFDEPFGGMMSSGSFTSTQTTTTIVNGKVITRMQTVTRGPNGSVVTQQRVTQGSTSRSNDRSISKRFK